MPVKTQPTEPEISASKAEMLRLIEDILASTACKHPDAYDIPVVSWCPVCGCRRALHPVASLPLARGLTTEQDAFRQIQNALVSAMTIPGVDTAPLRAATAKARPILHSWGC